MPNRIHTGFPKYFHIVFPDTAAYILSQDKPAVCVYSVKKWGRDAASPSVGDTMQMNDDNRHRKFTDRNYPCGDYFLTRYQTSL